MGANLVQPLVLLTRRVPFFVGKPSRPKKKTSTNTKSARFEKNLELQCSGAVAVTLALRASTSAIHAVPPVDVGMCRAAEALPRLLRASFP